jgi:hypothetical protein
MLEGIMNLMKVLPIASTFAFVSLSTFAQQPPSEANPSQLGFLPDRLAWISEGANKSWCSPAGEKTGPGKAAAGRPLASVA